MTVNGVGGPRFDREPEADAVRRQTDRIVAYFNGPKPIGVAETTAMLEDLNRNFPPGSHNREYFVKGVHDAFLRVGRQWFVREAGYAITRFINNNTDPSHGAATRRDVYSEDPRTGARFHTPVPVAVDREAFEGRVSTLFRQRVIGEADVNRFIVDFNQQIPTSDPERGIWIDTVHLAFVKRGLAFSPEAASSLRRFLIDNGIPGE